MTRLQVVLARSLISFPSWDKMISSYFEYQDSSGDHPVNASVISFRVKAIWKWG